jgi:hypothetical protein
MKSNEAFCLVHCEDRHCDDWFFLTKSAHRAVEIADREFAKVCEYYQVTEDDESVYVSNITDSYCKCIEDGASVFIHVIELESGE